MPDIRTLRIKIWFILIVASQLAACTLVPGQHMAAFSTQSSVEMPVTEDNEAIIKRIQKIIKNSRKKFFSLSINKSI